ncbi:TolB family protein [Dactylosporangium sp. NPDC048998]|uniref:TolB family protein n=1 Tax=Dactylosporangium sp. NPDC048998 TaxID=3363976 RepID=UPI003718ADA9
MPARILLSSAAVVATLALPGCARPAVAPDGPPAGDAITTTVSFASSGRPYGPLWLADGLYFGVEPRDDNDPHQLWRWRDGAAAAERVDVKAERCHPALLRPERRPGGELAVAAGCYVAGVFTTRMLAVDRGSGATSVLFRSVPGLGAVVWSGDTAYSSVWSGPCVGVVRLAGDRLEAIETGPSFDGLAWPASRWAAEGAKTCPETGRVSFPVTLDGTAKVAALATRDPGDAAAWTLYLADADLTGAATPLAGGFSAVIQVAATPDGSRFAVAATRDGRAGLYTVDAADGAVRLVRAGKFSGAALSPDGHKIASIALDGGTTRLVVFVP